ncbi:hypothetical protein [Rhodoplanes sp. SY1]|uniref:hypothetical protein n=1 Tax=Rhodoplanes sp. SY1 TaxID=3166646 RepID=UPI0038B5D532
MTTRKLAAALARVETWPAAAQDQLADLAFEIEASLAGPYEPTPEEQAGIDRGLADATAGRFASDAEVESVLARLRRP